MIGAIILTEKSKLKLRTQYKAFFLRTIRLYKFLINEENIEVKKELILAVGWNTLNTEDKLFVKILI